jgi:prepilin-type N-terminal cleavage/methylation domain-containing protein
MRSVTYKVNRGFTLAEAMIAVIVLAIAVTGVILPFTAGASISVEGMHRTLATELADNLMQKIINAPYGDIVTNYNYTEVQGQVKDYNGVVFTSSNYANFSRQVVCEEVRVAQQSSGTEPCFIRATVRVSYNGRELVSLTRLIGK